MKPAWIAVAALAVHAQDPVSGSLDASPGGTRARGRGLMPLPLGGGDVLLVGAAAGMLAVEIPERELRLLEGGTTAGWLRKDAASRKFVLLSVRTGFEPGSFDAQALQGDLAGGMSWRIRDGLSLGLGLAASHQLDGNGVHPFLDLDWIARDDLRIRGRLPAQAAMEWTFARRWSLGARWRAEGGGFAVESGEGGALRIQRLALEGFARRRVGPLALEGAIGWMVRDRILRVEDGDGRWSVWSVPVAGSRSTTTLSSRTGPAFGIALSVPFPERR